MPLGEHDHGGHLIGWLQILGPLPIDIAEQLTSPETVRTIIDDGSAERIESNAGAVQLVAACHGEPISTEASDPLKLLMLLAEALDTRVTSPLPQQLAIVIGDLLIAADVLTSNTLLEATRAALALGRLEKARHFATVGLDRVPESIEFIHLLSMSLEAEGRHSAATVLAATSEGRNDPAWIGRWSSNIFHATGRRPVSSVSDTHNELAANLAWVTSMEGNVADVAAAIAPIIEDPGSSPQAIVWASVAGAVPAALDGRAAVAYRLLEHARSLLDYCASELTPFAELQIFAALAQVKARLGDLRGAGEQCDLRMRDADPGLFRATWSCLAGFIARERGDFGHAVEHFDDGVDFFEFDPYGLVQWAQSERQVSRAMMGLEPIVQSDEGVPGLFRSCIQRNNAWILASTGDIDGAIRELRCAIVTAAQLGQTTNLSLAAVDLVRFGRKQEAAQAMPDIASLDSPLLALHADVVAAFERGDAPGLVAAATAARRLGIEPLASELVMTALMQVARSRDLVVRARIELCFEVRDARTPLLTARASYRPLLTERERELAVSAADGLSSREIAEQRDLSIRTVDNLLGRVYAKCGATGRQDLLRIMAEPLLSLTRG